MAEPNRRRSPNEKGRPMRRRGMTVLELLIVVGIISLLLGLTIPAMNLPSNETWPLKGGSP